MQVVREAAALLIVRMTEGEERSGSIGVNETHLTKADKVDYKYSIDNVYDQSEVMI
jgi:hypothetical protein